MKTMTLEEINFIRKTVFETVEFTQDVYIEFVDAEGISVEYDGKKAKIGANSLPGYARGCFLLAMELEAGKESISIQEKAHFKTCGIMLDCNWAVMKVDAVKKYMNVMVALGMNMLMLYTEDTYEIPNRPRFGYMRGRYTQDELREIVDYSEKIGIELIPCIQTLGHLPGYLRWAYACGTAVNYDTGENIHIIKNSNEALKMDCEETYRFIEDAIKACKAVFRSNRIHVGMDEATSAFTGPYLQEHGFQPKFEVFFRHLNRVVDICKKYDLKPMIWSDMLFRCVSKNERYNDPTVTFPPEMIETMPDVDLCYWDYGAGGPEMYQAMISKHEELNRPVNFCNAIQTWISPLVSFPSSVMVGHEGLKVCVNNNIDLAMTTIWGGTNSLRANTLLPMLTEYCYKGDACTDEDIQRASEFLTKIPFETAYAIGDANCIVEPQKAWRMQARRLLFGDILYDMACDLEYCEPIIKTFSAHIAHLKQQMSTVDKNYDDYLYALLVYEIGLEKAKLRQNLQKSYLENDREYLRTVAEEILPGLVDKMTALEECERRQWMLTYKMFGYEGKAFYYAGAAARMKEAAQRISAYLAGEISSVEELEAERIPNGLSFCNARDVVGARGI